MAALDTELLDLVRAGLARQGGTASAARVAEIMRAQGRLVGDAAVLDVVEALRRDTTGLGPLEELLQLDGVTDIVVNGPDEVFVDLVRGLQSASVNFSDDAAVRRLAQRLASRCGLRLDESKLIY